MITRDKLIEIVAREIAPAAFGPNPDRETQARARWEAGLALKAIASAGLAIVPREASDAAAKKGAAAILNSETLRQLEIVRSCYRDMIEEGRVK